MKIVGKGPSEKELMELFLEAEFTGWVAHDTLPEQYSSADLLILPSKFDTFSCVVLEALSCGLPVVAYNTKGPKDILNHGENGFLADNEDDIAKHTVKYLSSPENHSRFKTAAIARAREYSAEHILDQFLKDIELENISLLHGTEAF